mgnify:CR=1 FL=1
MTQPLPHSLTDECWCGEDHRPEEAQNTFKNTSFDDRYYDRVRNSRNTSQTDQHPASTETECSWRWPSQ